MITHTRISLNDGLVIKNFGPHPERGRRLTGIHIPATAGLVQKPFGRGMDRAKVMVQPLMVLHPVRRGEWVLTIDSKYLKLARLWLNEHCTLKPPVKKPKRKHHPREAFRGMTAMVKVDNRRE